MQCNDINAQGRVDNAMQCNNDNAMHRDVLTGPTERNPLVGILLERQARWCYQHRSTLIMMMMHRCINEDDNNDDDDYNE